MSETRNFFTGLPQRNDSQDWPEQSTKGWIDAAVRPATSPEQFELIRNIMNAIADEQRSQRLLLEHELALLSTNLLALGGKLDRQLIPREQVGERLRSVATSYFAGGHSHRARMLNALADELDPTHTMPKQAVAAKQPAAQKLRKKARRRR